MGLLEPYQDVLNPKKFVPGGVQLTRKLEPFWSTDQRLLVTTFNPKLSDSEDKQADAIQEMKNEVKTIKDNVTTMLEEIPQITSIEDRFSSIEQALSNFVESKESSSQQVYENCEAIQALDLRILSMEESRSGLKIPELGQDSRFFAVLHVSIP